MQNETTPAYLPGQTRVVTFRFAYQALNEAADATIDLCRTHRNNESAGRPLGPVNHGEHRGYCDVCDRSAK